MMVIRERVLFIGTQFSNIYAVPVRAERARESRNYVRAVVSTVERRSTDARKLCRSCSVRLLSSRYAE